MNLKTILTAVVCSPLFVFAHGEDKPGPHGGAIRMPGAFHTEVMTTNARTIKVHLLDMDWKNPTTKDSSVRASLDSKNFVDCTKEGVAFTCVFAKGNLERKGRLILRARREGAQGNDATYPLPLVIPKAAEVPAVTPHHH